MDYQIPTHPIRFPTPEQGNSLYPLPPDYHSLSLDDQRLARVNACCLQETPEDMVRAWAFFRSAYLEPLPEGVWYTYPHAPSPPAHYRFIYDLGAYSRNVQAFPRGFGKSKLAKEAILLWALTRPAYVVGLVKSNDDDIRSSIQEIMDQLESNELILRDFGELRPQRGSGSWSTKRLWLSNRFQLIGRSILGKMLGLRPDIWMLDDVEFDPAMRVSPTVLTEKLKYLYKNHLRPAVRRGCSVLLLGTLLTRRTFIYHMAHSTERDDPSVGFFNRVICGVYNSDGSLLWPEYWPEGVLAEMKAEMGWAAFSAQMLNDPVSEEDRLLTVHPQLAYYNVDTPEDEDPETYLRAPLSCKHSMVSYRRPRLSGPPSTLPGSPDVVEEIRRPFGETVSDMYRILLADPIRKAGLKSDFACCMVIGVERSEVYRHAWFILDMKLGRPRPTEFIDWVWEMGYRWRVKLVGVESISTQKTIAERTALEIQDRAGMTGWFPRVLPIRYITDPHRRFNTPEQDKGSRIASVLCWRFEQHLVKLPEHLTSRSPFSSLMMQIEDFTEDLSLLPHDDAIDTLAMAGFVIRPSAGYTSREEASDDPMALLERGERYFPGTSLPLIVGVDIRKLTPAAMQALEAHRYQDGLPEAPDSTTPLNKRRTAKRRLERVRKSRSLGHHTGRRGPGSLLRPPNV